MLSNVTWVRTDFSPGGPARPKNLAQTELERNLVGQSVVGIRFRCSLGATRERFLPLGLTRFSSASQWAAITRVEFGPTQPAPAEQAAQDLVQHARPVGPSSVAYDAAFR